MTASAATHDTGLWRMMLQTEGLWSLQRTFWTLHKTAAVCSDPERKAQLLDSAGRVMDYWLSIPEGYISTTVVPEFTTYRLNR